MTTQTALVPSEEAEQRILAQWLDAAGVTWLHVPNAGRHSVAYRVKQRNLGVKAGVPDILILTAPPLRPNYVGAAIELKRARPAKTCVSDAQRYWLELLHTEGWVTHVAHGADDAILWLTSAMGYRLRMGGGASHAREETSRPVA